MDEFDYLSYKQSKTEDKKKAKKYSKEEKIIALSVWAGTFAIVFILVIIFVSTKSSKIDIEYGRLGKDTEKGAVVEYQDEEDGEEIIRKERFTVDKRLFLIQQEEKGPSKSKVVSKDTEQSEVISTNTFNEIKTKNDEIIKKVNEIKPQDTQSSTDIINNVVNLDSSKKVKIKPKLPVDTQNTPSEQPKLTSAIEAPKVTSKVFVGRYTSIEEAKKYQQKIAEPSIVKKINNIYTIQVGVYENSNVAKNVAGKLKIQGHDVWIFQ